MTRRLATIALAALASAFVLAPVRGAERVAVTNAAIEERLKRDVTYLADPEREGRGAMTDGLAQAADYIADEFKRAGLKPGNPDGTYFQPFMLTGAVLDEPATLVLEGPQGQKIELKEGVHYHAFGLGGAGKVDDAPLTFAGYGVTHKQAGYEDYAGLDVRGKVVAVIRNIPRSHAEGSNSFRQMAPFVRKLGEAEKQGASAVLIVNDDANAEDGDDLLDFSFTALSEAGGKVPMIHLKRDVLDNILQASAARSLGQVERQIDRTLKPDSFDLRGWKVSLEVKMKRDKIIPVRNVIGVLEGAGPQADETVVIGAHYDHLGYGGQGGSLAGLSKRAIHHGADDNASGTTVMIELARRFAGIPERKGRRLVFMAFSAEELGLLGSAHYCSKPLYPLEKTVFMYNLDMVGRMKVDEKTGKGRLLVEGANTAKEFPDLVDRFNEDFGFQMVMSRNLPPNSDHFSFYKKKVPVLFFWTGVHPDYHKPSDTAEKINLEGMRQIAAISEKVVSHFATVEKRPEYVQVDITSSRPRSGDGPRLGIMPGYGDDKDGLLVEAVSKGGPAEKAGLQGGDRIIELAGKPVKNVQAYMQIMATQKKGDTLDVIILRADEKKTVKVKLE
jgi:hypothetical protein